MNNIESRVQEITSKRNLLEHPFYQAWTMGTLPTEKLALYSEEYGTFIRQVADLWDAAGDSKIAEVEKEHAVIWSNFALSMNRQIATQAQIKQVQELNTFIDESCKDKVEAIGALLAFEYQQPATVESKLKGLRDNYSQLSVDETYFEIHLDDWDEPEWLMKQIADMSTEDQERCFNALEQACSKLWDGLTGVYEA